MRDTHDGAKRNLPPMRFLWSHYRLLLNREEMDKESAGPLLSDQISIGPPLELA